MSKMDRLYYFEYGCFNESFIIAAPNLLRATTKLAAELSAIDPNRYSKNVRDYRYDLTHSQELIYDTPRLLAELYSIVNFDPLERIYDTLKQHREQQT